MRIASTVRRLLSREPSRPSRRPSARVWRGTAPGAQGAEEDGGESTQTLPVPDQDTQTHLDQPWQVIVWDDPVNLMNYVVYVFQRVLGLSASEAEARMLEVHNEGRSVVANEARERAEFLVARLHAYGLQATLEKSGD